MFKSVVKSLLPRPVRRVVRRAIGQSDAFKKQWSLASVREELCAKHPGSLVPCAGYTIRIINAGAFYMQYKDEFIRRIYHFDAQAPDPLVIDGGSNIGLSILYFKKTYPRARIVGFEPDPHIFRILQENVALNKLRDVSLINAGLAGECGTAEFVRQGEQVGRLGLGNGTVTVQAHKLSSYLTGPVDFVKLNIEGLELPVLQEAEQSGVLRNVRELVLEYHGWAAGEQRLGAILDLLDRQGYRYLVHDFDNETGQASKPPFRYVEQANWFCLVYARRIDN